MGYFHFQKMCVSVVYVICDSQTLQIRTNRWLQDLLFIAATVRRVVKLPTLTRRDPYFMCATAQAICPLNINWKYTFYAWILYCGFRLLTFWLLQIEWHFIRNIVIFILSILRAVWVWVWVCIRFEAKFSRIKIDADENNIKCITLVRDVCISSILMHHLLLYLTYFMCLMVLCSSRKNESVLSK